MHSVPIFEKIPRILKIQDGKGYPWWKIVENLPWRAYRSYQAWTPPGIPVKIYERDATNVRRRIISSSSLIFLYIRVYKRDTIRYYEGDSIERVCKTVKNKFSDRMNSTNFFFSFSWILIYRYTVLISKLKKNHKIVAHRVSQRIHDTGSCERVRNYLIYILSSVPGYRFTCNSVTDTTQLISNICSVSVSGKTFSRRSSSPPFPRGRMQITARSTTRW